MRNEDRSGKGTDRGRRTALRLVRVAATAVLALPCLAGAAGGPALPGSREIPLGELAPRIRATEPIRRTDQGLAVDVDGHAALFLPLPGAALLQISYVARGPLLLTWLTAEGTTAPAPHTTPWHHLRLGPGAGEATLEFRDTPAWGPERTPLLLVEGVGSLELTGLRVVNVSPDPATRVEERDAALRGARLWVGHTTIHFSDPPTWWASRRVLLLEVLGVAFVAVALGGALVGLGLHRRWRPAPFVAGAAIAVTLLANAASLHRAWPALSLRPRTDPESRLRQNLHLSPELGELTALARETLRPDERVGVQVRDGDWFAWETLCFHLAPRTCVRVVPGQEFHDGLYAVHRLRARDLDALVHFRSDAPLLPGFVPVAQVGPRSLVARRP